MWYTRFCRQMTSSDRWESSSEYLSRSRKAGDSGCRKCKLNPRLQWQRCIGMEDYKKVQEIPINYLIKRYCVFVLALLKQVFDFLLWSWCFFKQRNRFLSKWIFKIWYNRLFLLLISLVFNSNLSGQHDTATEGLSCGIYKLGLITKIFKLIYFVCIRNIWITLKN